MPVTTWNNPTCGCHKVAVIGWWLKHGKVLEQSRQSTLKSFVSGQWLLLLLHKSDSSHPSEQALNCQRHIQEHQSWMWTALQARKDSCCELVIAFSWAEEAGCASAKRFCMNALQWACANSSLVSNDAARGDDVSEVNDLVIQESSGNRWHNQVVTCKCTQLQQWWHDATAGLSIHAILVAQEPSRVASTKQQSCLQLGSDRIFWPQLMLRTRPQCISLFCWISETFVHLNESNSDDVQLHCDKLPDGEMLEKERQIEHMKNAKKEWKGSLCLSSYFVSIIV